MVEELPLGFGLVIDPRYERDGQISGYGVKTKNTGLPLEIVMTVLHTWLRSLDDAYTEDFKNKQR